MDAIEKTGQITAYQQFILSHHSGKAKARRVLMWTLAASILGLVLGAACVFVSPTVTLGLVGALGCFVAIVRKPYIGLAMILLIVPLVPEYLGLDFGKGIPNITPYLLFSALGMVALVMGIALKRIPLPTSQLDLAVMFFVLCPIFSLVGKPINIQSLRLYLGWVIIPACFYFLATSVELNVHRIRSLTNMLLVLAVLISLYSFWEQYRQTNIFYPMDYPYQGFAPYAANPKVIEPHSIFRSSSSFEHPLRLGVFLGMLLPYFTLRLLEVKGLPERVLMGLGVAIVCAAVVFTFGRGAWLSAFVGLVYMYRRNKRLLTILFLLAVLGLCGMFLMKAMREGSSRLSARLFDLSTFAQRLQLYRLSLLMYLANPVLGIGYGNFSQSYVQAGTHFGFKAYGLLMSQSEVIHSLDAVHNSFLFSLLETGAVGIIGLLLVLWNIWRVKRKAAIVFRHSMELGAVEALTAGIVVYLCNAMLVDSFSMPRLTILFWFFAASLKAMAGQGSTAVGINNR